MINAEKYRKEILNNYSGFSVIDSHIDDCESILCESCLFSNSKNDDGYLTCINRKVKWLLSEYKEPVKLTEIEYYILKYVKENTEFKYLVRLENGNLCAYFKKPFKDKQHRVWANKENVNERLSMFNDLFEFINCEDSEPTSIQEVLSNCEVIKNESDK